MTRAVTKFGRKSYLTMKEEKALAIYVSNKCTDIKGSLMAVGYSENSAANFGPKLLKTEKAKKYLAGKIETALKQYNKTADDVLLEAALVAFFDPADVFKSGQGGEPVLKNIFEMGPSRRAIKKIKHTQRVLLGEDESKIVENEYRYEFWSKTDMVKMLAQHHNLISPESGGGNTVVMPLVFIPDNGRDRPGKVE